MSLQFLQLSLFKRSFKYHAQAKGAFGFSEINVFLIILTKNSYPQIQMVLSCLNVQAHSFFIFIHIKTV